MNKLLAIIKKTVMQNNAFEASQAVKTELLSFFNEQRIRRINSHLISLLISYIGGHQKTEVSGEENLPLRQMSTLLELLETVAGDSLNKTSSNHPLNSGVLSDQGSFVNTTDKETLDDLAEKKDNDTKDSDSGKELSEYESDSLEWKAIEQFFNAFSADEYEEVFWEMLKRSLTNEADETSASDRDLMISFYEHLKKLIESTHDLWEAHISKEFVVKNYSSSSPQ
jgi:hypothetical protein